MKSISLLVLSLVVLSFPVPAAAHPTREPNKIGVVLYLTGDLAMQSAAFREGIELAIDEVNQAGEERVKLKAIYEDCSDPKSSNTAVRKLISVEQVSALLVLAYDDIMINKHEYERHQVPVICLWDANPEIDAAGDYVFAIGPWTPSAGGISAAFASKVLKAKTAAIVGNHDVWSEGVIKYFVEAFESRGGKVLETLLVDPAEPDYRSIVTKVKAIKPDVVYSPVAHNVVSFYSQYKQLGVNIPVVTSDIIAAEHIEKIPEAFEGVYQSSIKEPDSPRYHKLKRAYETKFKKPITLPWFVARGYDGVMLLTVAIERGGGKRAAIKDELYKTKGYVGASSTIDINEKGSSPAPVMMYQIRDSKFVPLEFDE